MIINCVIDKDTVHINTDDIKHIRVDYHDTGESKLVIYQDTTCNECAVCLHNTKNTVFYPCGHYCFCYKCAQLVNICPYCRKDIKVKIYEK